MAAVRASGAFVGRARELAEVAGLVAALEGGRGGLLLIEGEAGIGKSRLVQEGVRLAGDAGAEVFSGSAVDLDRTRPFQAIAAALGARPGSADDQRATIARMLRDVTESVGVGHRVQEACLSLIEQSALRQPLLLVLEDLHWADPSTLSVVRLAARQAADLPVAVIATFRRRPRSPELAAAIDDLTAMGARLLAVPPMGEEEARLLVGDGGAAWNDRAGGNPFFLLELARAAEAAASGGPLPPDLKDLLLRRVRQLPAEVVEVLRVASVLGSGFALTDLGLVLRRSVIDLVPLISDALAAGLLVEAEEGLRFRHDLIREALYSDQPRTVAAALHLEAAWALAAAGADAVRVAPHLLAGAQPGDVEAIAWLRRASEQAGRRSLRTGVELLDAAAELARIRHDESIRLTAETIPLHTWAGALDEAIARGTRVLESVPPPALELEVRRYMAEALALAGRDHEVVAHVDAALRLPDVPTGAAAELLAFRSRAERDREVVMKTLDEARSLAESSGEPGPLAIVLVVATHRAIDERRLTDAGVMAAEAVAAARTAASGEGDPGRAAARLFYALQIQGVVLHLMDRTDEAIAASEEARRLAAELGAETVLAAVFAQTANYAFDLAQFDRALAEIDAYTALTGDELRALYVRYPVAVVRGDDEAEQLWSGAAPLAEDPWFTLWRGRQLLGAGRSGEALGVLRQAWDGVQSHGYAWLSRTGSVPLVRAALDAGETELAAAVVAESVELGVRDPEISSLAGTGRLVRAMVERDLQGGLGALEVLRRTPEPVRLAGALVEVARLAQTAGQRDTAMSLATEALEMTEAVGAADLDGAGSLLKQLESPNATRATRPRRPRHGWESLTPTELMVVDAVSDGLSNPQIASRLYMSRHTVESHVKHVFVKLGFGSRVELAAEAVRRRIAVSP